jgi:molybdopterin-guanine dinucleotide biosynthesis protein A
MPSAAILVGGRARRFGGQDKSQLVVEGRSILDRQLDALTGISDDVLLVGGAGDRSLPNGIRWVPDFQPDRGPLGGLAAALAAARDDELFLLACDMPFVTQELLRLLLETRGDAEAVVPRTEHGYHPLCAVYTRQSAPAVTRRLADGDLKMVSLLDDLTVQSVLPGQLAPLGGADRLLANINSRAALHEIETLLGHKP